MSSIQHTGLIRERRSSVAALVVAFFVACSVLVGISSASPVSADEPDTPLFPDCTGDDDDDTDVQCLPNSDPAVKAIVLGSFGGPGTITIRTSFTYPACDDYTETQNCYFSVSRPRISGCTYHNGDQTEPQSCGSYESLYSEPLESNGDPFTYESGTATSFGGTVSQLNCQGAYSTVYVFGGDQRTDFVWRTRGPRTANCDITVDLPTPDALPGTTFLQVAVGGRVCEADSGINCSKSFTATSYAWLPVFGTKVPPIDPVVPARLFDSRPDEETVDGTGKGSGNLPAGTTTCVKVAGRGGVPVDASAVVVNATAFNAAELGFVTLFARGSERPTTSSLNYSSGRPSGNTAIVDVGAAGEICAYTSTDVGLTLDVTSYIGTTDGVKPLEPARLVDSRRGGETADGELAGSGRLAPGEVLEVPVVGRGEVPGDSIAVAVNATVVGADTPGFITLYPCDGERPNTSSLNFAAGEVVGNSAIVSLSGDGLLCAYTTSATELVLDVTTAFSINERFNSFNPQRVLETRSGQETDDGLAQGGGKIEAGGILQVDVAGRGDVPENATAVAANVSAVGPEKPGYLTLFPCDEERPLASSLNFDARSFAVNNSAIAKLDGEGSLCIYAHEATHVILDVGSAWTD